jgi:cbb3-type cytochrome oxidase subunit 3
VRDLPIGNLAGNVHPASLIGSAKVSDRGFSFYLNRELTSVLAPGVFIVVELSYLVLRLTSTSSASRILSYFRNLSGAAGLVLLLVETAVAYVIGYIVRELAFRLLGRLEKIPAIRRELTTDTGRRLVQYFDEGLVEKCFEAHPYLKAKLQTTEPIDQAALEYRTAGGANVETRDYESFVYAKLWIKNFCSGFNIDQIELEINMLVAALAPSVLLAVDILVSIGITWWTVLLIVVSLGVAWWVFLNSLFRLRRTERWEAVRNLIMDYAMRTAAIGYPLPSATDEAPE